MSVHFTCCHCNATLEIDLPPAGLPFACPACGAQCSPQSAPTARPRKSAPSAPARRPRGGAGGFAYLLIFLLLALIVGVVGWGALGLRRGEGAGGGGAEKFVYEPSELAPFDPAKVVSHPTLPARIVKDQVLVTLQPGTSEQDFRQALGLLGEPARIIGRVPSFRTLQLEVPADKVQAVRNRLANHPYVAAAGLNFIYTQAREFNDPALGNPDQSWGIRRIRAPEAWDITTGGAKIAIVDTGAKVDHEELAGKAVSPWSAVTRSPRMEEREFMSGPDKDFLMGHGTHVAITAAGTGDNGRGTVGIAPASPVVPVQVLRYYPETNRVGTVEMASLLDGFARAIGSGAQVINYSVGPDFNGTPLQREYLSAGPERRRQMEQEAAARAEAELPSWRGLLDQLRASRVVLVKSAGNSQMPAVFDPLCYSGRVISVAALDQENRLASFSNYGPYTTVSAPGVGIYSGWSDPNQPYKSIQGTSMAAPHVTGVVALMKTLNPNLTFEEVRDILRGTGRAVGTPEKPAGPLVDARAALEEVNRRLREQPPPPPPLPPLNPPRPVYPAEPTDPTVLFQSPTPWVYVEVQWYIDLWLYVALPPSDGTTVWVYDRWGQVVNINFTVTAPPPGVGRMARYEWIWRSARTMASTRYGTLYEFVRTMVRTRKFNPAPPPVYRGPLVRMPAVVGLSFTQARARLQALGMVVVAQGDQGSEVRGMFPAPGSMLARGSAVTVVLRPLPLQPERPALERVPALVGLGYAQARERLQALGLRAVAQGGLGGTVRSTNPPAGARVRRGGIVTLVLSGGAEPRRAGVVGAWKSSYGPVTLVGSDAHFTGHWMQSSTQKGLITRGTFNAASGVLEFDYYQKWNSRNGKATMKLSADGKSLSGRWEQWPAGSPRPANPESGGWSMRR